MNRLKQWDQVSCGANSNDYDESMGYLMTTLSLFLRSPTFAQPL